MKIHKLITAPNKILRTYSEKIDKVDKALQIYMDELLATMYDEGGAGLASIQIGIPKRIMVIDVGNKRE
jgi:peptide deformylase